MTFYLLVFILIKFVNVYKFLMQINELRKRADQKKVIWENRVNSEARVVLGCDI